MSVCQPNEFYYFPGGIAVTAEVLVTGVPND